MLESAASTASPITMQSAGEPTDHGLAQTTGRQGLSCISVSGEVHKQPTLDHAVNVQVRISYEIGSVELFCCRDRSSFKPDLQDGLVTKAKAIVSSQSQASALSVFQIE